MVTMIVGNDECDVTTVDSVITHTAPWTPKVMGFHRVWVPREVIIEWPPMVRKYIITDKCD